jgi:DNA replication protein DnaC
MNKRSEVRQWHRRKTDRRLIPPYTTIDYISILEDRHGLRSTLITSQLPVDHWHELITNSTVADAISDRLVHNGYRITLKGESMRKIKNKLT